MLSFIAKRELSFLESIYVNKVVPNLKEKYSISNPHLVPHVDKVIVSMRLGRDASDKKAVESSIKELSLITGFTPAKSYAKKSIAGFKLREGQIAGAYCTLRKRASFEFLERLCYIALPRIRDFKGFSSKSFDSNFNFSFGIKDHLVFEELSYDSINKNRGLDIVIALKNVKSKEMAMDLLKGINFPVKK